MDDGLVRRIADLAAANGWIWLDEAAEAYAVDGVRPLALARPSTLEEAARLLDLARRERLAVIPRGSGTKLHLGAPPRAAHLVLSTEQLAQVVEHTPADLTVTVQAGTRLADLQTVLARHGQFLPLDPPYADRATIGGILATNASGPLRLRYGAGRDLVIGTRVANTNGTVTRAGGKVVKNVTGYDLNKLHIGALGTVGVLGEVTFKVVPLPAASRTVAAAFATPEPTADLVRTLVRTPAVPTALEVLDPAAAARCAPDWPGGWLVLALATGFLPQVRRQVEECAALARRLGAQTVEVLETAEPLWTAVREFPAVRPGEPVLVTKISLPLQGVLPVMTQAIHLAGRFGFQPALLSHAGVGIIWGRFAPAEPGAEAAGDLVAHLRRLAGEHGGFLVVEACPPAWKVGIDVWGPVGPSLALMRRLKAAYDPENILNPGRFVGGL